MHAKARLKPSPWRKHVFIRTRELILGSIIWFVISAIHKEATNFEVLLMAVACIICVMLILGLTTYHVADLKKNGMAHHPQEPQRSGRIPNETAIGTPSLLVCLAAVCGAILFCAFVILRAYMKMPST